MDGADCGMYLEIKIFNILLILEGFFTRYKKVDIHCKYDLHFDLIKGSTSSNRSSDFCLVQKAVVLHLI